MSQEFWWSAIKGEHQHHADERRTNEVDRERGGGKGFGRDRERHGEAPTHPGTECAADRDDSKSTKKDHVMISRLRVRRACMAVGPQECARCHRAGDEFQQPRPKHEERRAQIH